MFPEAVGRGPDILEQNCRGTREKPEISLEGILPLSLVDGMDALGSWVLRCGTAPSSGLLSASCLWALPWGSLASRFVLPLTSLHHLHGPCPLWLSGRPGASLSVGQQEEEKALHGQLSEPGPTPDSSSVLPGQLMLFT